MLHKKDWIQHFTTKMMPKTREKVQDVDKNEDTDMAERGASQIFFPNQTTCFILRLVGKNKILPC